MLYHYFLALGIRLDRDSEGSISMKLSSSADILAGSQGEVTVADTVHYRTKKGVIGGLFCPRIFGNGKEYACDCGKYTGIKYKGIRCPVCGVMCASLRKQSGYYGHIKLPYPLVKYKLLSDTNLKKALGLNLGLLNKLIERKKYLGVKNAQEYDILESYAQGRDYIQVLSGAEGIQYMLKSIDVEARRKSIFLDYVRASASGKTYYAKNLLNMALSLCVYLDNSAFDNLFVNYLPVLPRSYRPLVFADAGSYVSTELNNLYLRFIRRVQLLQEMRKRKTLPILIDRNKHYPQEDYNEIA
jgi:DNA-directed RNA polymerase subunit beta'